MQPSLDYLLFEVIILNVKTGWHQFAHAGCDIVPIPPRISQIKHLTEIHIKIGVCNNPKIFTPWNRVPTWKFHWGLNLHPVEFTCDSRAYFTGVRIVIGSPELSQSGPPPSHPKIPEYVPF